MDVPSDKLKQYAFSFYLWFHLKVCMSSSHSGVFIANFEHVFCFDQVFQLLNLIKWLPAGGVLGHTFAYFYAWHVY